MDVIFGAGALIVWWVIRNAPSGAFWLQSASTHLLWSAEHRTELHCLPPLFTCPTPHHLSLAICALPGLLASFSCSSCGCPECPQGRRAAPQLRLLRTPHCARGAEHERIKRTWRLRPSLCEHHGYRDASPASDQWDRETDGGEDLIMTSEHAWHLFLSALTFCVRRVCACVCARACVC